MKVTLLNTYLTGGAGIASRRLFQALNTSEKVDAKMIVQDKSEILNIESIINNPFKKVKANLRLTKDLFHFIIHERSPQDRFQFSPGMEGTDIHTHPQIVETDIIHLHWINQGFLSLNSIKKLSDTGKPIIWTLHDMWAFTGGCHYSGRCLHYEKACGYCPYLRDNSPEDLSSVIWRKKKEIYESFTPRFTFVTCSNWLKELAKNSSLLKNSRIESIPNPIDTEKFKPYDKKSSRKKFNLPETKKLILFGAMNIDDPRKGFIYLLDALKELYIKYPELTEQVELVSFGKTSKSTEHRTPFPIHHLGKLKSEDELIAVYSAADVFILPSLQDNLPNTIMESMACGTPAVAFHTGGIPEMISHLKDGFLAPYKSSSALAEGIHYVLTHSIETEARKKILGCYAQDIIASKYIDLYKETLQKL